MANYDVTVKAKLFLSCQCLKFLGKFLKLFLAKYVHFMAFQIV